MFDYQYNLDTSFEAEYTLFFFVYLVDGCNSSVRNLDRHVVVRVCELPVREEQKSLQRIFEYLELWTGGNPTNL